MVTPWVQPCCLQHPPSSSWLGSAGLGISAAPILGEKQDETKSWRGWGVHRLLVQDPSAARGAWDLQPWGMGMRGTHTSPSSLEVPNSLYLSSGRVAAILEDIVPRWGFRGLFHQL